MKQILSFAFIIFFANNIHGQSLPGISANGIKEIKEINTYLKSQTTNKNIPGIVAVVANINNIIYKNAFGLNTIKRNDTMNMDNLFFIASMTKAITCVAVMQLLEKGKIHLDDPASKFE